MCDTENILNKIKSAQEELERRITDKVKHTAKCVNMLATQMGIKVIASSRIENGSLVIIVAEDVELERKKLHENIYDK